MHSTKSQSSQQSLLPFDRPPANGTATSQAAADRVAPRTGQQAATIIATITEATDGLTRHEIAERCGLPLSSVCGRVRSLVLSGHLLERGDTRPTSHGCPAKVVRKTEVNS